MNCNRKQCSLCRLFGQPYSSTCPLHDLVVLHVSSSWFASSQCFLKFCWSFACFSGWGQGFRSLPYSSLQVSFFMGFAVTVELVRTAHLACKFIVHGLCRECWVCQNRTCPTVLERCGQYLESPSCERPVFFSRFGIYSRFGGGWTSCHGDRHSNLQVRVSLTNQIIR